MPLRSSYGGYIYESKRERKEQNYDDVNVQNKKMFMLVGHKRDVVVQRTQNNYEQLVLHTVMSNTCWWGAPLRLF